VKELKTIPEEIRDGLGIPLKAMYETKNKHIVLAEKEQHILEMQPDFSRLRDSKLFGYAVTAIGDEVDFVSRTLVPHTQSLEDFATGSSHAMLVPFWANRLGKNNFKALQLSSRGGEFQCELQDGTVTLSGEYRLEKEGELLW
ncbi:PhzF family phenazine biosynthesis protein, partial [Echinicola sediminis]